MSRDHDLRAILDRVVRSESPGNELPRGGRSGGTTRPRERASADVRDALTRQLDLPRGADRERVDVGGHSVALRGSEARTLALVGAFRVADARDLESRQTSDRWHGDLEHLRREGLIALTPHVLNGQRTALVTLTRTGQALLEQHRHVPAGEAMQNYYSGLAKPREATHDAQPGRACTPGLPSACRPTAGGSSGSLWTTSTKARLPTVPQDRNAKGDVPRTTGPLARGDPRVGGCARPARRAGPCAVSDVRIEYEHRTAASTARTSSWPRATTTAVRWRRSSYPASRFQRSGASHLHGARGRHGGSPFDPHAAERVLR